MGVSEALRRVADRFDEPRWLDDWETEAADEEERPRNVVDEQDTRGLSLMRPRRIEFACLAPVRFDEAQQIADALRAGTPVIAELQGCEPALRARLVDFCSGLVYALDGGLRFVGQTVLLLTPADATVSGESLAGVAAGGFFNQR